MVPPGEAHVVDALGMFLLMFTAVNNLGVMRGYYSDELDKARGFLATDPDGRRQLKRTSMDRRTRIAHVVPAAERASPPLPTVNAAMRRCEPRLGDAGAWAAVG